MSTIQERETKDKKFHQVWVTEIEEFRRLTESERITDVTKILRGLEREMFSLTEKK